MDIGPSCVLKYAMDKTGQNNISPTGLDNKCVSAHNYTKLFQLSLTRAAWMPDLQRIRSESEV